MKILILFFCIYSLSTFCEESFKIEGRIFLFKNQNKLLVYCLDQSCVAKLKTKEINTNLLKKIPATKYVNSVGSNYCHYILEGKSILGKNSLNDGRSFCYFTDHSMIEINSLTNLILKLDAI